MPNLFAVTASTTLNLRSSPKLRPDNIIGAMPHGHIVTKLEDADPPFVKVSTTLAGETLTGFCSSDFLEPAETEGSGGTTVSQQRYDKRTEANIATLQTDFADRVRLWLAEARKQGLNPYIHFGSRSVAKQEKLHEKALAGGPKAAAPKHSYHCYGRAFDWVNILDPDGGDKGLGWDDDKAYAKGTQIAERFDITGIHDDNDHMQDAHFPTFTDLSQAEFGHFPTAAVA
jgi:hypothetical protein